jgi:hypothetical protein
MPPVLGATTSSAALGREGFVPFDVVTEVLGDAIEAESLRSSAQALSN